MNIDHQEAIRTLNTLLRFDEDAFEGYFLRGIAKYNLDDLLGAEDDISIGSDYDGCRIKPELRGIEKIPSICVYLEEHGIPEEICKKIFFENAAHFFERVLQPKRVML